MTLVDYYEISAEYFLGRCRLKDKTESDTMYFAENYTESQAIDDLLSPDPICRGIIVQHISHLKQIKSPPFPSAQPEDELQECTEFQIPSKSS